MNNKLGTSHKTSSDHDSRYYTEYEIDSMFVPKKISITLNCTNGKVVGPICYSFGPLYIISIQLSRNNMDDKTYKLTGSPSDILPRGSYRYYYGKFTVRIDSNGLTMYYDTANTGNLFEDFTIMYLKIT